VGHKNCENTKEREKSAIMALNSMQKTMTRWKICVQFWNQRVGINVKKVVVARTLLSSEVLSKIKIFFFNLYSGGVESRSTRH
jgi:hypothetical protein